jgi:hypothetical protein
MTSHWKRACSTVKRFKKWPSNNGLQSAAHEVGNAAPRPAAAPLQARSAGRRLKPRAVGLTRRRFTAVAPVLAAVLCGPSCSSSEAGARDGNPVVVTDFATTWKDLSSSSLQDLASSAPDLTCTSCAPSGPCLDFFSDFNNCGRCGVVCDRCHHEGCAKGVCTPTAAPCAKGSGQGNCLAGEPCTMASDCSGTKSTCVGAPNGFCTSECNPEKNAPDGTNTACCDAKCVGQGTQGACEK